MKKNVKVLSDHPSFYEDAQAYWNRIDASPHGMMGGLESLSTIDLTASTDMVFPFVQVSLSSKNQRAILPTWFKNLVGALFKNVPDYHGG